MIEKELSKSVDTSMIDKVLNDFLEPFEAIAEMGDTFCYCLVSSTINYTLLEEPEEKYFLNHVFSLAPDLAGYDGFLISFLHELGHHYTLDELSEDEVDESLSAKYRISDEYTDGRVDLQEEYYNLPDEAAATNWAIEYIRNNREKIDEFWSKLLNAIVQFYEANVTELN